MFMTVLVLGSLAALGGLGAVALSPGGRFLGQLFGGWAERCREGADLP